ncbi:energy transducer TonB [Carboxylicivirga sp. RSCT41]|uniref:energy transducer TonB n=1 Tax=Carboxylicivirga agarovorans TaxID=3417570 RepID=UPI003D32943C
MKHLFIILAYILMCNLGFSQKKEIKYYGANNKVVENKAAANYYLNIKRSKNGKTLCQKVVIKSNSEYEVEQWTVKSVNDSTISIKSQRKNLISRRFLKQDSLFVFWDLDNEGNIIQEGRSRAVFPLHLEGEVRKYYSSGQLKSTEVYENNQLLSNENWLENGDKYFNNIFYSVDIMPEYPGGEEQLRRHIATNINLLECVYKERIQGKVIIGFVITEEGSLEGLIVEKKVHSILDNEALRVIQDVSHKKWTPGILNDKKVKVKYSVPISFVLH